MNRVSSSPEPSFKRRRLLIALHFVLMIGFFYSLSAGRVRWDRWDIVPRFNTCFHEGYFWLHGHLDLPLLNSPADSALFKGRIYNVFPPLFSLISAAVMGIEHFVRGEYQFPPVVYVPLIMAPLLLAAYWAFYVATGVPWRAVLLCLYFLLGTAAFPQLAECQMGGVCQVNHILSQIGLLLIAADCLGQRRVWPSLLGLAIAAWSRQLTLWYALALVVILPRTKASIISGVATLLIIIGLMMTLNTLKFGSPLESGYRYIYVNNQSILAERAAKGIFSPRFIPDNFYYMNLALPTLFKDEDGLYVAFDDWGTCIWLGSPVFFYLFVSCRQWWADRRRRALVLATIPVIFMLLMYHTTGFVQMGYYRFGLDFVPIFLAVIAPYLWGKYRTPITVVMLLWSIIYFRYVTTGAGDWYFNSKSFYSFLSCAYAAAIT